MDTKNTNAENEGMELRLWNYIDGNASGEEKTIISRLLENEAEWKLKYNELLRVNELLQSSELDSPSMRFGKNVMEEIAKLHIAPATRSYINKKLIWGLGIFLITMFVGFLVYGFAQMDFQTDAGSSSSFSDRLNQVDYSKFFSNTWMNVMMMINVVLALFLLDNYLTSKKRKFRGEI